MVLRHPLDHFGVSGNQSLVSCRGIVLQKGNFPLFFADIECVAHFFGEQKPREGMEQLADIGFIPNKHLGSFKGFDIDGGGLLCDETGVASAKGIAEIQREVFRVVFPLVDYILLPVQNAGTHVP